MSSQTGSSQYAEALKRNRRYIITQAISIFTFGKRTRNAPISAATAPEAPSVGARLLGLDQA